MTQPEHDACFERWIRDHVAILYRVSNGFAVGADRQDLMQELLLAVWKAVPHYRGDAKLSTFLYRVSHNAAMTWKRAQRTYRRKVDAFAALPPAAHTTTHERAALVRLYAAIRELPELDRSLILLSLDGVSYRDMAEIHGLSETNVGVRLNRIRGRLAQTLKESDHEPR